MLNEVIAGISRKLNTTFGDEYEIYENDVVQDLTEPCFFIAVLEPGASPLLGTRGIRRYPFDIHYFPKQAGNNAELFSVAERLFVALEYIPMADGLPLRGTSMKFKTIDGVLHFFVNYNPIVIQPKEENPMETLTTNVGTKKG